MADGPVGSGGQTIDALLRQLAAARAERDTAKAERDEARLCETAAAEILSAINASSGDFKPVFELILDKAMVLCNAAFGGFLAVENDSVTMIAERNTPPPFLEFWQTPRRTTHVLPGHDVLHIEDVQETEGYRKGLPVSVASMQSGIRTILIVPLLSERRLIGIFALYRVEVKPFTDRQVALVRTFAAQAVTAMENARLIDEQREALEQQTATADILRVISQSPTDVQPVLDAVVGAAVRFCGAIDAVIMLRDGDFWESQAHVGPMATSIGQRHALVRQTAPGLAMLEARTVHFPDITLLDPIEYAAEQRNAERMGFRAVLTAPMLRDGVAIGVVTLRNAEAGPFTPRQIELLETFAAQAVIAIENVRLFIELRQRTDDLTESLEYQTATSELLEVISRSTSDIQPVLDTMLSAASRLCDVQGGAVAVRDGEVFRFKALSSGERPEFEKMLRERELRPGGGSVTEWVMQEKQVCHVPDIQADPRITFAAAKSEFQTLLGVPMLREGDLLGVIVLTREKVDPFTDRQIALIKTFADQAVIAMENARLLSELTQRTDDLTESLEYQTATSEVLEVIGRSTSDIQPVLDTMLSAALRLCRTESGGIAIQHGDGFRYAATLGWDPEADKVFRGLDITAGRGTVTARVLAEGRIVQVADVASDPEYALPDIAERAQWHTALGVPLLRDDRAIGVIAITRNRVEPFTERQIALVKTFADQAVIAMENARLLGELTRREQELSVTFDNMGDGVVMFDAALNLASWNRNFQELLDVPDSFLASRPGLEKYVRLLVSRGELGDRDPDKEVARYTERANRKWSVERTRPDGRTLEVRNNPVPGGGAVLIYSDITRRKKAEAEIRAALDRQTATADILKVIASSPTDVQPVLDVVAKAAVRFCGATDAVIHMRDGNDAICAAHEGPLAAMPGRRTPLNRETGYGVAILDCQTTHRPDVRALDPVEFAADHRLSTEVGFRAALGVPLLREGTAIGSMSLLRIEPGAFTQQQIELAETFAAQAVIAIENVRLFTELRESLERLKAAQANLIQAEKMASLGQLTAGIAHEIKNPLNFVNNFAGLSRELLDEAKQTMDALLAEPDDDKRAELQDTMDLLSSNLAKIVEHGQRADGIVKSMLAHSRGGTGDWQQGNLNGLVEEALNLAFHGARAQDKEFNVTLERDFDPALKPVDVVPQDVTRVFLNLIGNGFYATRKRARGNGKSGGEAGYRPTLRVVTRETGTGVEIRVRDNGTGITPDVRQKLFQPFFTTKPTGEGTGLGLSISYDIVTQQHGGSIEVESEPDQFTEFIVRLPRARRANQQRGVQ